MDTLSQCRAPLAFFMQHWAEGPFRNGLRLGAFCLGCCWALMALLFVGGIMNLWWIVGLALYVLAASNRRSSESALTRS